MCSDKTLKFHRRSEETIEFRYWLYDKKIFGPGVSSIKKMCEKSTTKNFTWTKY
jgi:hypothetical protein